MHPHAGLLQVAMLVNTFSPVSAGPQSRQAALDEIPVMGILPTQPISKIPGHRPDPSTSDS